MMKLASPKGAERCRERIGELEAVVREIQGNMGEVTTQSAETWHDNAPYDVLVQELRLKNRMLNESHDILRGCQITPYPVVSDGRVSYGTRVVFSRDSTHFDFSIVGYGDSDFDKGRILYTSPLSLALMGHMEGDSFYAIVNKEKTLIKIEKVDPITDPDLV